MTSTPIPAVPLTTVDIIFRADVVCDVLRPRKKNWYKTIELLYHGCVIVIR